MKSPIDQREKNKKEDASCGSTLTAQEQAIEIGNETQLLLDDYIIKKMKGLKRVLHQPTKKGLIKNADGSNWDRGDTYAGKIVCRDDQGRFHMTYRFHWSDPSVSDLNPSIGEDKAHWYRESVAYAYSDDGVRWQKPILGLVNGPTGYRRQEEFPLEVPTGMSKENNLGCPFDFIYDLNAHGNIHDPQKRFLLRVVKKEDTHPFAKIVESQMYYAADWPDFVNDPNWKEKLTPIPGGRLSPRGSCTSGYDHQAGVWFSVSQDYIPKWLPRGGRDIARCTSPDLVNWQGPELVLPIAEDESKDLQDWIEYMDLAAYRVGEPRTGVWLGQLLIFHSDRSNPQYQMPGKRDGVWRKGTTELRLIISRDAGKTWQRICDKEVWLPYNPEPHGYDRLVFPQFPIRVGDELWLYYTAYDGDHLVFNRDGSLYEPGFARIGRTALATLRWNGYVSLDAGKQAGELVTKPLIFNGSSLTVNLQAKEGELKAGLQEASGKSIPGFALEDALPTKGDGVSLRVNWQGKPTLKNLAGRPVCIQFAVKNCSLYSFGFQ